MIEIVAIDTPSLGDRGYLATDGTVAVAVDVQRDFDRVAKLAADRGVTITHVLETHIHNDYVTGGLALARAVGAEYLVNGADPVSFDRTPVTDGELVRVGDMRVQAIATPGHTFTHLSYVLSAGIAGGEGPAGATGQVLAVFTGGALLNGSTGRTDLLGADHKAALSRAQFASARRLARELPDAVPVCPTHGFGSFCSATPTSGDASTIGRERRLNSALTSADEDTFVKELLAGLTAYPRYYAHMGPANRGGPAAPDLSPPQVASPADIRRHIDRGEWVVDLRGRRAFAREHVSGTVSVELGDPFATYLGWVIPWGTPLTLIGDSPEQVAEAQRQLIRIGIDSLEAAATGPLASLAQGRLGSYPVTDFPALVGAWNNDGLVVLDVRRPDEWQAGHLAGAVHIPFWELEARTGEVPPGEVWVHCASGFRASIGASVLDRAGRDVVHVDDDWPRAAELGLPVTPPGQA
jgi:hydroxyacylglutathione hydrolase